MQELLKFLMEMKLRHLCIKELEKRNVCKFNDDEKSKLVGNMMIVLNMDKGGNAIINCK